MNKRLLALYSAGHFWVDLSCALLLFGTLRSDPDLDLYLMIYNFCAFALQMPLGLLTDRLNRNGAVAAAGCMIVAAAYLSSVPLVTVVTAGAGNALFHLGGGVDVLNVSEIKASALGVFISPGAVGVFLGSFWGKRDVPVLWPAPAGLLMLAAIILWYCRRRFGSSLRSGNAPVNLTARPMDFPTRVRNPVSQPSSPACLTSAPGTGSTTKPMIPATSSLRSKTSSINPPDNTRAGALLLLFLVVVLRSYMGMNQTFSWKSEVQWASILVLALALGKAAGGFLMDAVGSERSAMLTLIPAAILYLASAMPLPGILAVFFFNMTMPVTLWAVARLMPGVKGFSFGFLSFGLYLGFLPSALGLPNLLTAPWVCSVVALVSLALLLAAFTFNSTLRLHARKRR